MMKSGWLFLCMLISVTSALGQTRTGERNLWGRDEVKTCSDRGLREERGNGTGCVRA